MPVPSQRQPCHPHSLSQFTYPRRFEHGNSSRKKRLDAPCNLALISATGFLVAFTSICNRFRDHKKNDRFPDSSNTRYSPSGHVSAFSELGTTPSSILWVYRHKRIESYIGIEHVFCLVACVERLLNPGCFLTLSNNTRPQHGLISTCWASTISPMKSSEAHREFSP